MALRRPDLPYRRGNTDLTGLKVRIVLLVAALSGVIWFIYQFSQKANP